MSKYEYQMLDFKPGTGYDLTTKGIDQSSSGANYHWVLPGHDNRHAII
jgi:hypothetical protein